MTNLLDLAGACERATGEDRELNELIADALFERSHFAQLADAPIGTGCMMWWQNGHQQSALRYTSSLDAAMTLADGLTTFLAAQDRHSLRWKWELRDRLARRHSARAETPALALTAAALKALATLERE